MFKTNFSVSWRGTKNLGGTKPGWPPWLRACLYVCASRPSWIRLDHYVGNTGLEQTRTDLPLGWKGFKRRALQFGDEDRFQRFPSNHNNCTFYFGHWILWRSWAIICRSAGKLRRLL